MIPPPLIIENFKTKENQEIFMSEDGQSVTDLNSNLNLKMQNSPLKTPHVMKSFVFGDSLIEDDKSYKFQSEFNSSIQQNLRKSSVKVLPKGKGDDAIQNVEIDEIEINDLQ